MAAFTDAHRAACLILTTSVTTFVYKYSTSVFPCQSASASIWLLQAIEEDYAKSEGNLNEAKKGDDIDIESKYISATTSAEVASLLCLLTVAARLTVNKQAIGFAFMCYVAASLQVAHISVN